MEGDDYGFRSERWGVRVGGGSSGSKEDDRVDFGSVQNKRKKKNEGILGQRI